MFWIAYKSRAWREAEYDVAATVIDGFTNGFNFIGMVRVHNIVNFDVIHAPRGIKLKKRIVIFLSSFFGHV
jgi:hypothetical protein